MKTSFLSLLFVIALFCGGLTKTAEAGHFPPYVYHHGIGNPWGWGSFYYGYPGFSYGYPNGIGFTYWPYYNYNYYYSTYGVISFSVKEDKPGYAFGYSTLKDAVDASTRMCGADCQPVVWVQGGCASLFTSSSQQRVGWAYATSRYTAERNAQKICKQQGATDCVERAWVCSY